MLLSEFLNTLYIYSDKDMDKASFFLFIVDTWINASDVSSNPFQNLKFDTIERYYNKTEISTQNAKRLLGKADMHSFAKYINGLSATNQSSIEKVFKKSIPDFDTDETLGHACADLFIEILSAISNKVQTPSLSDTSSHTVVTPAKEQPANTHLVKLFYQSFDSDEQSPSSLTSTNTVINLNENPNKFSQDSASNVIYRLKTTYNFDSEYAPDLSRKVILTFEINDISVVGFTSADKWIHKSHIDNFLYLTNRVCTAWFYVLSTQSEKTCVKFLMIGDSYD